MIVRNIGLILAISLTFFVSSGAAAEFSADTPVYYDGGKRAHIDGCPRLSEEAKAAGPNSTFAEMRAQGGMLCSRCPGSQLNVQREAANPKSSVKPLPANTVVYYDGGKRGHLENCPRFNIAEANPEHRTTLAQMQAQGGMLCSRCPGGKLNLERVALAAQQANKKTESSTGFKPSGPAVDYDPTTIVYLDALWNRAHAADCPELILKDKKPTMTLAEADQAGIRIGISGQSGRDNCCFVGYYRKHPQTELSDATMLAGNDEPRNLKHVPGCHRYWPKGSDRRQTKKEWEEQGFKSCAH